MIHDLPWWAMIPLGAIAAALVLFTCVKITDRHERRSKP